MTETQTTVRKRVLKLGTECEDRASKLLGTLTHWVISMSGNVEYLFQPKGLDEQGQPVKKLYLCRERLQVSEEAFEVVHVPFEILGTQVTDKASGFTGMAVQFVRHVNGCFHVVIQPTGKAKSGAAIACNDFDLRQCVGDKIPKLTEAEHKASTAERPSPEGFPERSPVGDQSVSREIRA